MRDAFFSDLKTIDYEKCLALQRAIHGSRIEGLLPDTLLLVEHPHVLTFGRRANQENVLVSESALHEMGVGCVHIERGGDVTYHGPGQILAYPIFAIEKKGIAVLDFVERLEEIMIRILMDYGINGERDQRNRGVWVKGRKIGFVGIAVKKGISFHGLALNVSPDLGYFGIIHSCGLREVGITSMAELLDKPVPMAHIKTRLLFHFKGIFDMDLKQVMPEDLFELVNGNHDS